MYKDKHHSVSILLFFYINCLLIPVYVESSDTLSVVIIPFMKMENNPKIPTSAIYKPLSVLKVTKSQSWKIYSEEEEENLYLFRVAHSDALSTGINWDPDKN